MSGRKSIIAVILALIVCFVLIPTGVFAQDAEVQSEPDRTADVSTSSETTYADNSGDTAEASSVVQAVDTAVNSETTVSVEDTIEESKEEAPTNEPIEDTVSDAETDTEIVAEPKVDETEGVEEKSEPEPEIVEEPKVDEPEVIEEKSEVVEPIVETNLLTNDLLTQPDEAAALINSEEPASSQNEVIVDLDLTMGDVTIEDNDGDDSEKITVTGKDADGNEINKKKIANGSTIRVSQSNNSTAESTNVISIILTKVKSFVTVILNKLNISNDSKAPITAQTDKENAKVALELDGENTVTSTGNAAIHKSGAGELVIQDKNGTTGSLTAENKNADEHSINTAATIGGDTNESVGKIVISGAKVTASTADGCGTGVTGHHYGAAIGGGQYGSVTKIEITDKANVTAVTGEGAPMYSSLGAAIGGGESGSVDSIIISGNSTVTATTGSFSDGAAIGAGRFANFDNVGGADAGNVGSITISDSKVEATTYGFGAAIGGAEVGNVGSITISNSKVNATTHVAGAAIGTGAGALSTVTNIFIEKNSDVKATATENSHGAAIGAGPSGSVRNITISDSKVEATTNGASAAIGGGSGGGGVKYLTIRDSTVTAVADSEYGVAAIGRGLEPSEGIQWVYLQGKAIIDATATGDNVALQTDNLDVNGLKGVRVVETGTINHFLTEEFVPTPFVAPNPERNEEEKKPFDPFMPKKDALVESKTNNAIVRSNVEITGATAKITVTDNKGRPVDPKEVTIKSVAAFEQTGAVEASIQLTRKLTVDLDVAAMKEASSLTGSTADVVTVTNEGSVITVKSGAAELVSVDVKAVVSAAKEPVTVKFSRNFVRVICNGTVYAIDLTGLDGVGTLTLRLAKGVLKIYDSTGSLLMEVKRA